MILSMHLTDFLVEILLGLGVDRSILLLLAQLEDLLSRSAGLALLRLLPISLSCGFSIGFCYLGVLLELLHHRPVPECMPSAAAVVHGLEQSAED